MPWPGFLLRAGLTLLLVPGSGAYLAERFRIGYDDQDRQCLPPYRWFLIDRHDRAVTQGALVAFAAQGLQPYFRDGQTIIKRAAGVPGDRIQVGPQTVWINGAEVGEGLALAGTLFAFAADTPRARVAFRGVAEDESLMDFVRQIYGLLAKIELVPEVVLDPTPFATAGIDIAPVLLAEGPDGEPARIVELTRAPACSVSPPPGCPGRWPGAMP
jgi:conjugal transfer pilin signal peptidase TrbI